jgi:hypothetical protein
MGRLGMRKLTVLFFGLFAVASALGAEAQAVPPSIGPIEVKVKIKPPDIKLLMSIENLNTDYRLELKESFLPKIVESLEKKPF